MTYNRVILAGNVGRHVKRVGDGGKVLRFTLATERWEKVGGGGGSGDGGGVERREVVEWHDVVYFHGGEVVGMIEPGVYVLVDGRLVPRVYDHEGEKRRVVEVHAQRLVVLRRGRGEVGMDVGGGGGVDGEEGPF